MTARERPGLARPRCATQSAANDWPDSSRPWPATGRAARTRPVRAYDPHSCKCRCAPKATRTAHTSLNKSANIHIYKNKNKKHFAAQQKTMKRPTNRWRVFSCPRWPDCRCPGRPGEASSRVCTRNCAALSNTSLRFVLFVCLLFVVC